MKLIGAVLAVALAASAAAGAPLQAYSRLPAIEAATVSPDGSQLALIVSDGERRTVAVQDIATRSFKARADFGETPVQGIRWAGERHLLITTAVQFDPPNVGGGLLEWRRLHVFDVVSSTLKPLMTDTSDHLSAIQRVPQVRVVGGKAMVFVEGIQFVERRGFVALFQVDVASGRSRVAQPAVVGSRRWLVDGAGRVTAREMVDEDTRRSSLQIRDKAGWRTVREGGVGRDGPHIVGLGQDGASLVFAERDERNATVWQEIRPDGKVGEAHAVGSHAALVDPQTGVVLGHSGWDGDAFQIVYFDASDQRAMQTVRDAYPAISTSIGSWSNDRSRVVAWIDRPGFSPAYALFDLAARRAEWIASEYPALSEVDIGPQTRVRFKAADGLELAGYLTRPPGRSAARGLPLVVLPHDRPSSRDVPGFDWMAQAYASRGYAVLQVNYRGSEGSGRSGAGEIGRGMQSDLSDGVRALAAGGLVDPKRVCIVGMGYGGYAAMVGAALEPEVYRCAVSVDGYFSLRWPKSAGDAGAAVAEAARRRLGVEGPDDVRLVTYSPVRQASRVAIPVLLVQSRNDASAGAGETEQMAEALRKAGKPAEVVMLPDGDQQFSRASARAGLINATVNFLEKHNPPN